MAYYQSELTQFLRQFFAAHPEEKTNQLAGHLIFWNKKPTRVDEDQRMAKNGVKQKADPYRHR